MKLGKHQSEIENSCHDLLQVAVERVPQHLAATVAFDNDRVVVTRDAVPHLDYAGLAELYVKGEFVEIPLATETYYLEVGSLISDDPLTSFDFDNGAAVLKPSDAKYLMLKKLADDLAERNTI